MNSINYWISKIDSELKEGVDYSIIFFNGDNYKSFLNDEGDFDLISFKKLNQNCGIILDSDRSKKGERHNPKKKKIMQSFESEKKFCWLTMYREIENYIPYDVYKMAVEDVTKREINLSNDFYADWSRPKAKNAQTSFKARIKLPESIFSTVQRNGDGTTKDVDGKILRKAVNEAIQATANTTFQTPKVLVAKKVVSLKPDLVDSELKRKMKELVKKIRGSK